MNQKRHSRQIPTFVLSLFLLFILFQSSIIHARADDIVYPYEEKGILYMQLHHPSAFKEVGKVGFCGEHYFKTENGYDLIVEANWYIVGNSSSLAINDVFQPNTKYIFSVNVRALNNNSQVPLNIRFLDCDNKIKWDTKSEKLERSYNNKGLLFTATVTLPNLVPDIKKYNLGDVTIDFTSGETSIVGEDKYNGFLNFLYLISVYDESIVFNYSEEEPPTMDIDKDSNLDFMLLPVYKDGDVNGVSVILLGTSRTSGTYTLELGEKSLKALPDEMRSHPEYFYSKATFVISKSTNDKPIDPKDDKTVTEPTKENTPQVNTEAVPAQQNKETLDKKQKNAKISKVTAGKKSFTLKWKRVNKGINGYEIQYATDKKFKKNAKIVNIGKSKTTSKKVKGLKSGKSYFVRIRTYKLVDGNKVISNWSTYKKIKVK
ncbi:fibronectin type III domain-containing protein [Butyrivibrio sp. AE3006]|uniref:fibronectin type III domain-containing protein n=1 Tax=Butyrivibrio sp. AE3006 TaxID=1280673 RepID=UPI001FA7EAA6|nr:fibronectin type III domain-containing protein [Butyrivibrio sp. AE3006]